MERSTSVLRVLTDISEVKPISEDNIKRSFVDVSLESANGEDFHTVQNTTRLLQKKNQLHPIFAENHPYRATSHYGARVYSSSRGKVSDFTQRIMSAKLLRVKELRNQLAVTQHQLNELINENRLLKTMQKRQETALRKYEGTEARLPQLIQSHNEEVRILTSKFKQVKGNNQKLSEKLKITEAHLANLQEQHVHLLQLTRDQHLGEREHLASQVQELQTTVQEQNNIIQILNRKVDLERKNYKHELSIEINKRKDLERKLTMTMQSVESLKDQIEPTNKPANPNTSDTILELSAFPSLQAKEKYINSCVPKHYVRSTQSQAYVNHSSARPQARYQAPPTAMHESVDSRTHTVSQLTIQSGTDQTGDETDMVSESGNGHTTTDSTKTLSNSQMPKIKQQISSRGPRSHYKLSGSRKNKKEKSSTENETPAEYSSSFPSSEVSLKEVSKVSASDSEKIAQMKKQITIPMRRFSIDSSVTNKTDRSVSDKIEESPKTSFKSRRNSLSVNHKDMEKLQEMLKQDDLNAKVETQKSIKDELRELEEKLMKGSNLFGTLRETKFDAEQMVNDESKGMITISSHESDGEDEKLIDSMSWNELQEKIQTEREQTEAKLEEYYNNIMKTEYNIQNELHDGQKEKLLRALKHIDRETQGLGSSEDSEDGRGLASASTRKSNRRKSDGYNYNFTQTIENLHRGRPVYENVRVPVVEKMRREEKEYISSIETTKMKKSEIMKELFGSFDNIDITNGRNFSADSDLHSSDDIERLVQKTLNLHETVD